MPKKGEPEEDIDEEQGDEESAGTQPGDADDDELPNLENQTKYELQVTGKDGTVKSATVYADPTTNKIVAYVAKFPSKDPNAPTSGVMYMQEDGPWVDKGDGEATPYTHAELAVERANLYQTSLDKLLADRKAAEEAAKKAAEPTPVPPTEAPKEEDAEVEDMLMDDDLETKVATTAPAQAKDMDYKFVNGIWSAYVAVYKGGKKIGEYSAFGGKVTGPNAEKLAKPVLERIKEEYFNGMKGK